MLAYADDIVLLAPTADALRRMLKICDNYASEFNIIFNAEKSKCLIARTKGKICGHINSFDNIVFLIGGIAIYIVDEWPHVGHTISFRCDDKSDISNRRNCMVGHINNVICYFNNLDSLIKLKLVMAYCTSHYGCEIWDLWSASI